MLYKLIFGLLVLSNILWADEYYSSSESAEWKELGVYERAISSWKACNYNTPNEAKEWIEAGITNPYDIEYINKEFNLKTPAEAKKWLEVSDPESIKDWISAGITTADEVKEWIKINIYDAYSAEEWIKAGVKTPKEVKDWRNMNVVTPNNVIVLRKDGINSPEQLKKLREEAIAIEKAWDKVEIPAHYIADWINVGIATPEEAGKWKKNGFYSAGHANDWLQVGVTDSAVAKAYHDAGISYEDIKNNNHMSLQDIKKWNKIGAFKIVEWKKVGIDAPQKAKSWIEVVGDDPEYVNEIMGMGFETPIQYRPYKNMNLENAAKLYKWKIKPNKLIESMSYGNMIFGQKLYFESKSIFIKAYDRLKSDCTEIVKDKWFAGIDISENKNKCYTFVGTMVQRLDEKSFIGKDTKSGLVSGTGGRYIYVEDFEGSWMENKTKIGVIKGDGSFSYNSRNGKKVVPRGTVIFLN